MARRNLHWNLASGIWDEGGREELVGFFVAFLVIFFDQTTLKSRHGIDERAGGGTSENIGCLHQGPRRENSCFASRSHCVKNKRMKRCDGSPGSLCCCGEGTKKVLWPGVGGIGNGCDRFEIKWSGRRR